MFKAEKTQPPLICWGWEICNKKRIYKQSTLLPGTIFAVKTCSCPGSVSQSYLHLNYHHPKLLFQGYIKHIRIYLFSERWCHQPFSLTPKTSDQGSATEFNPLGSCKTCENIPYTVCLMTHFWTKIFSLLYPPKSPLIFFWDYGIHKIIKNSAAGTLNKQVENYYIYIYIYSLGQSGYLLVSVTEQNKHGVNTFINTLNCTNLSIPSDWSIWASKQQKVWAAHIFPQIISPHMVCDHQKSWPHLTRFW